MMNFLPFMPNLPNLKFKVIYSYEKIYRINFKKTILNFFLPTSVEQTSLFLVSMFLMLS